MQTHKINVGFNAILDSDGNGFSYFEDTRIPESCYARNGSVVKQLKAGLEKRINSGLNELANWQQYMIGTVQGEVFIVQYRNDCWQYSIGGPGRNYAGSTLGGMDTFAVAKEHARRHAESSFGGIALEHSF